MLFAFLRSFLLILIKIYKCRTYEKLMEGENNMSENNEMMIYEDKDGITKVNVKFTALGPALWNE